MESKSGKLTAIIVFLSLGVLAWGLYAIFSGSGPSGKEREMVMRDGVKATATLLTVERTNNTVNNIHQYAFTFRVQPDSGPAFEFTRKKLIDPIYMSNIKPGMTIPAHSLAGKEGETVIHWEEAGIGDAF